MASVYDQIELQINRAKSALVEGRFDDAITQAELCLLDLSVIPDGQKEGDAGASLTWNREAIVSFIDMVKLKRIDTSNAYNPMGITTHPMESISERPLRGGCYRG